MAADNEAVPTSQVVEGLGIRSSSCLTIYVEMRLEVWELPAVIL